MINRIYICGLVLLNLSNSFRKRDKIFGKPCILYLIRLKNSIKHEHSCKIPYLTDIICLLNILVFLIAQQLNLLVLVVISIIKQPVLSKHVNSVPEKANTLKSTCINQAHFDYLLHVGASWTVIILTLKAPRKNASENVVC